MKLKLKRPICFIDLETTGLDTSTDRIVEIAILKYFPDGKKEIKTRRLNPEIPISETASELHGITNEMVANEPTFKKVSKSMLALIDGCDVAGFNSNSFDFPLLYSEFLRAGLEWDYSTVQRIDIGNLFKKFEPRTLTKAYEFYCGKDLVDSHGAKADIEATLEVLEAQLEKYELPDDLAQLAFIANYDKELVDISGKFIKDKDGDYVINFGVKHKGKKAITEPGFLEWMLGEDTSFTPDVKRIASALLESLKPEEEIPPVDGWIN